MAPKVKKKKKTKEELEEERRLAEEAARLAEEERLRVEEEERQRLAALEAQRQELLGQLRQAEGLRLADEHASLAALRGQQVLERNAAAAVRQQDWEWERFLSCTPVPHPRDKVAISDHLRELQQLPAEAPIAEVLGTCQDCYTMVEEAVLHRWQAELCCDGDAAAKHAKDVQALHELVNARIDLMTAHTLQHADEHANAKGDIQLGCQQGSFQWALWVNTAKNPRLRAVELSSLHAVVELPKQVALAGVALRLQIRDKDEFFAACTNEYMAVGGVLTADLLALPPPAKSVRHWVIRQVTPLATRVVRVPYPIPPAGADPATYRSEEEPPPFGLAYPYTQDTVLLDGAENVKVGWWDPEARRWDTSGVTDVVLDKGSSSLSFRTQHLGPLAVLQSRTRLLPYTAWGCRPTGGQGGRTASLSLTCPGLAAPLVFEVGPGWATLTAAPAPAPPPPAAAAAATTDAAAAEADSSSTGNSSARSASVGGGDTQSAAEAAQAAANAALRGIVGVRMPPEMMLLALSSRGVHLMPEDRDAQFADVTLKDKVCENAMCDDLALLGGVFLIARSRWNQGAGGAGPDECIVRISEVTDWEAGGRTEAAHHERVFAKEKEDGDRRVLAAIRRGDRGVAFCDALDKRPAYPSLPNTDTVENVQACMDTVWGQVHASLLTLLAGPGCTQAAPAAEPSTVPGSQPANSDVGGESSSIALGLEPSEAPSSLADSVAAADAPVEAVSPAPPAALWGPPMNDVLTARLCASPAGLELVRTTDPLFTQTLGQLLRLLRVFSFS